jgi:hypothetical protein
MARITDPQLPTTGTGPLVNMTIALVKYLRQIQVQINAMSGGSISASTAANTAPPVAGNKQIYTQGDFIPNLNPVQLGSAGSMYVVTGWICIASGTPGTWVACRSLTGN